MTEDREREPTSRAPPEEQGAETSVADDGIITLQDLAPRHDVRGGAGKLLFGQDAASRKQGDA